MKAHCPAASLEKALMKSKLITVLSKEKSLIISARCVTVVTTS